MTDQGNEELPTSINRGETKAATPVVSLLGDPAFLRIWIAGGLVGTIRWLEVLAVGVYTLALRLFDVEVGLAEMLGYLPVIFFGAAVPTPMRAAAITLWVTLFPERPAEMAAFGIVQHNFFIFFNATIGMIFIRRANRELFNSGSDPARAVPQ